MTILGDSGRVTSYQSSSNTTKVQCGLHSLAKSSFWDYVQKIGAGGCCSEQTEAGFNRIIPVVRVWLIEFADLHVCWQTELEEDKLNQSIVSLCAFMVEVCKM